MKQEHKVSKSLVDEMIKIQFPFSGDPYEVTVMEMLDVMPKYIVNGDDIHNLTMEKEYVYYSGQPAIFAVGGTLTNALAEMILWLHENNYLTFNK